MKNLIILLALAMALPAVAKDKSVRVFDFLKTKMRFAFRLSSLIFVLLSLCGHDAVSQNFLFQTPPQPYPQLSLRFQRPNFAEGNGLSALSGAYDLMVNTPIGGKINLLVELPFSSFSVNGFSESSVGNLFVGLQHRSDSTGKSSLTFGVFLPTAGDDAGSGALANFYEIQKYGADLLTLYFNYGYRSIPVGAEGGFFGFEIGPNLFIPTSEGGDTELFLHYGLSGGYQLRQLAFLTEFTGLFVVTEEADSFTDRFFPAINLGAQWTHGMVNPGIFYNLYLDEDLQDAVNGVLGIRINIKLNRESS